LTTDARGRLRAWVFLDREALCEAGDVEVVVTSDDASAAMTVSVSADVPADEVSVAPSGCDSTPSDVLVPLTASAAAHPRHCSQRGLVSGAVVEWSAVLPKGASFLPRVVAEDLLSNEPEAFEAGVPVRVEPADNQEYVPQYAEQMVTGSEEGELWLRLSGELLCAAAGLGLETVSVQAITTTDVTTFNIGIR
jgi:hypothetical protein